MFSGPVTRSSQLFKPVQNTEPIEAVSSFISGSSPMFEAGSGSITGAGISSVPALDMAVTRRAPESPIKVFFNKIFLIFYSFGPKLSKDSSIFFF